MKYAYIAQQKGRWGVARLCRVLKVRRSGYYAWKRGRRGARHRWREHLLWGIRRVYLESRRTYGSPRVQRSLEREGYRCCENSVAWLMKAHGIRAKMSRKYRVHTTDSTHGYPVAGNHLNRAFSQVEPNRAWAGDITYVPTREGWLYVAVVLDLYSRRVVGWAFGSTLEGKLVNAALLMAVDARRPGAGLLVHSDRGVQYACDAYQRLLGEHGMRCSMSRKGNCYDNAVVESFYKTLKAELVEERKFKTRVEAEEAVFEYVAAFYNRRRLHSALGYLSPEAFEAG